MKRLILVTVLLATSSWAHADLLQDFDSLGGNDVLLEKAQALNPEMSIRIVQDRIVPRRWRHEFAPEMTTVLGGDAYTETQMVGLNYHLHISPRWSLGLKYSYAFNQLSEEGAHLIEDRSAAPEGQIPAIDYAQQAYMGLVNWYPIYGKMNLHDLGVVHFDVYLLGGYGQMELRSGATQTWTGGGGLGLWFSQHLTSRLEMRYQSYEARRFPGKTTPMELTIASLQIGYML